MVLRALGYKNVVESAGTWPTNYITKANELQLLKDARDLETDAGAKRGNVAVVLWNMLRTKMWDIQSENQTNGMTYGETDYMLNVKFPDYQYLDEAYVTGVSVDNGEVTVALEYEGKDQTGRNTTLSVSGTVENVDLPRILEGMRVSSLVKNYDEEDAEILTLTPYYNLAEGIVAKATSKRVTVGEDEYKFDSANTVFKDYETANYYVVMEVNNKTVNQYDDEYVYTVLPTKATEVENLKTMESRIDEDALVIIDGEWATRDDIEVGDIYTEISSKDDGHLGDSYYMVSRERDDGTFESLTYVNDGDEYVYVEIDGNRLDALTDVLRVYDEKDGRTTEIKTLEEITKKDNKYLEQDVEYALNYLGLVVRLYFGDVAELDGDGDFYVVTSDGYWTVGERTGSTKYVALVGPDGEEETYAIAKGTDVSDLEDATYAANKTEEELKTLPATFVYVEFNSKDEVKLIEKVIDEKDDFGASDADNKYKAAKLTTAFDDKNNMLGTYKVTSGTLVYTVVPLTEKVGEKYNVIGFDVTVSNGTTDLDGVGGHENKDNSFVIFKEDATNQKAVAVLVSGNAKSTEKHFGVLVSVERNHGVVYATIDNETYEVDNMAYTDANALCGQFVVFTLDEDVITLDAEKGAYDASKVTAAKFAKEFEDDIWVTFDGALTLTDVNSVNGKTTLDVTSEDLKKNLEDYEFVVVNVYADKDDNVLLEKGVTSLGKGSELLGKDADNSFLELGDRVIFDKENSCVLIFRGFDEKDQLANGKWTGREGVEEEEEDSQTTEEVGTLTKGNFYSAQYAFDEDSEIAEGLKALIAKAVAEELDSNLWEAVKEAEDVEAEIYFEAAATTKLQTIMNVKNYVVAVKLEGSKITLTVYIPVVVPDDTDNAIGTTQTNTLQENVVIAEDGKVTGTLKNKSSFTDFSSVVGEQTGHYIALTFAEAKEGRKVNVKYSESVTNPNNGVDLDEDGILVLKLNEDTISGNKVTRGTLTVTVDGVVARTLDLTGLTTAS